MRIQLRDGTSAEITGSGSGFPAIPASPAILAVALLVILRREPRRGADEASVAGFSRGGAHRPISTQPTAA